tara:strand:- start:656 stop:1750 length:1095 start_codon:yes stop_codon:yes gene_type:complete
LSILILGSDGFIGRNIKYFLRGRGINFYELNRNNKNNISNKIKNSEFIIHLADKIKSKKKNDFQKSLVFTKKILSEIKKTGKKKNIIYASSVNINTKNNLHYNLKRNTEKILKSNKYFKSYVLRLPNIFGKWCRPNYNSFFTTACYNIPRKKKIKISSNKKFPLVHVSDVCEYILKTILTKRIDKNYLKKKYIYLSPLDIKNILLSFNNKNKIDIKKKYNLNNDEINKIFSTYLFYNKKNYFVDKIKKIKDFRGEFSELIKDKNFGQISLLTVNPKQERGNHFHDYKIEKFFVLSGKGKLIHQNILDNKLKAFNISDSSNVIYSTIPGWSHKIKNVTKKKLIILIWSNEVYNKNKPDTIKWIIK